MLDIHTHTYTHTLSPAKLYYLFFFVHCYFHNNRGLLLLRWDTMEASPGLGLAPDDWRDNTKLVTIYIWQMAPLDPQPPLTSLDGLVVLWMSLPSLSVGQGPHRNFLPEYKGGSVP